MWTKQRRRSHASRFILPLMSIAIMIYFAYHVYHGQYGLHSYENVSNHIRLLEEKRALLEKERLSWQKQIALLKDGHIEKDMLDEYARHNLNLAKKNELIILNIQ